MRQLERPLSGFNAVVGGNDLFLTVNLDSIDEGSHDDVLAGVLSRHAIAAPLMRNGRAFIDS